MPVRPWVLWGWSSEEVWRHGQWPTGFWVGNLKVQAEGNLDEELKSGCGTYLKDSRATGQGLLIWKCSIREEVDFLTGVGLRGPTEWRNQLCCRAAPPPPPPPMAVLSSILGQPECWDFLMGQVEYRILIETGLAVGSFVRGGDVYHHSCDKGFTGVCIFFFFF